MSSIPEEAVARIEVARIVEKEKEKLYADRTLTLEFAEGVRAGANWRMKQEKQGAQTLEDLREASGRSIENVAQVFRYTVECIRSLEEGRDVSSLDMRRTFAALYLVAARVVEAAARASREVWLALDSAEDFEEE